MRIRSWNAFASNNSGSYTIVGVLPSAEVAASLAEKLRDVIERHTAWLESDDGAQRISGAEGSPLAEFCRELGLSWETGRGAGDEWPQHYGDSRPEVAAVGAQLIVHHPYTVTLPPTFGEVIYKHGGRVQHEEDHAHHPILAIASFWWGWTEPEKARQAEERLRLLQALLDGPLLATRSDGWPPAWQASDDWMGPPLVVGAAFADLLPGVEAMRALGETHGATMRIQLLEAPDEAHDPFAHLRPSTPPVPRYDVRVLGVGPDRPHLVTTLAEAVGSYENRVEERLVQLPATFARGWTEARAQALAETARQAGAAVLLTRNDA